VAAAVIALAAMRSIGHCRQAERDVQAWSCDVMWCTQLPTNTHNWPQVLYSSRCTSMACANA